MDKGDIADLLQDPTELMDALQEGVDSEEDAVDAKEDTDMLDEYKAELRELMDLFSGMERALSMQKKQQIKDLKKSFANKWRN